MELSIISSRDLQGETISLFSLFDIDVQEAIWPNKPTEAIMYDLDKCVRIATLFPQYNIASASNFYESAASREISKRHPMLFNRGPFIFAFKEEHPDFFTHAKEKQKLCPDSESYRRERVKKYSAELKSYFGRAFARCGGETSEYIAEALLQDLSPDEQMDSNSLASIINDRTKVPPNDKAKYEQVLHRAIEKRGELQINKPYFERTLRGLPRPFVNSVENRLLHYYLVKTYETTGIQRIDATIDLGPFHNVEGLNTQNFSLWIEFMDLLGISPAVMTMTDRQLLELKTRPELIRVMNMFQRLIDEAADIEESKKNLYWEYWKEKGRIGYPRFVRFLEAIAPPTLVESVATNLPALEKIMALSIIYGSEVAVEYFVGKRINVDNKPLRDLKKVILEEYSSKLEDSAVQMLEVGDYPEIQQIPAPFNYQMAEIYLLARRAC